MNFKLSGSFFFLSSFFFFFFIAIEFWRKNAGIENALEQQYNFFNM